jgi:hypothetical protein
MEGIIRRYFDDLKMGSIQIRFGKRYAFSMADWMDADNLPAEGMGVMFEVGSNRAVNVRPKIPDKADKPRTG